VNRHDHRLVLRWVPGYHWVQFYIAWPIRKAAGSTWLYRGLIYQCGARIGPIGFGWMAMRVQQVTKQEGRNGG
jgi:hypothetical protein